MAWMKPDWTLITGRVQRVIDLGIPPEQLTAEQSRRIRVLTGATLGLSTFAGIPWIAQYFKLGFEGLAWTLVLAVAGAIVNLEVLRRSRKDRRAGNVAMGVLAAFVAVATIATGGLDSPNWAWFTLVPLCAAAVLDLRGATQWTLAMLGVTVVLWAGEASHLLEGGQVPEAFMGSALVFNRMVLLLAVGVLGMSFVNAQRETERELSIARDKAELEATYRELLMHAAVAASEAASLADATTESIHRICEAMGWVAAVAYEVGPQGTSTYAGQREGESQLGDLWDFVKARSHPLGRGAVGQAAATGVPQLIAVSYENVPPELAESSRAAGVNYAFAVPVLARGEVHSVLEFALAELPPNADQLKAVFGLIGRQLGKVRERTQLNEKMRQRQKMEAVGQLAAGVAHEINTPMSYVRSNLHSLRERVEEVRSKAGAPELTEVDELIEESLEGVEHTIRIVRDVRELSHMGGDGSRSPERSIESLAGIADGALRVASAQAPAGVTFAVDHGEEALCTCSPHQIQQVLVNLLVNACHAVGERGQVWLETGTQGGSGFVRVRDDGHGISASDQARLFEPFFTTKAVGHGTGLGLSVSYEIVSGHDGDIWVMSDPGEGATFEVRLPLAEPDA